MKTSKGQTALEYLLIIVVAITVVAAIMVWFNASMGSSVASGSLKSNEAMCRSTQCITADDCFKNPPCLFFEDVECEGMQKIGESTIHGKCAPSGNYDPAGYPVICTPASLPTLSCRDFDMRFSGGSLGCNAGGRSFDVSQCYYEGTFSHIWDEVEWESMSCWPMPGSYTAPGDVILSRSSVPFFVGQRIKIINGPNAGTYSVIGSPTSCSGATISTMISLNHDIQPSGEAPFPWSYWSYGDAAGRTEIPRCGNGVIEPQIGEVCDGGELNGKDCSTIGLGYTGGSLACKPPTDPNKCTWDASGCWYYEGTVLGTSDYSCCCGDIICSSYGGRCGGTCMGKKVTFTGGTSSPALSGTYNICQGTRNIGGAIRVNQCSTTSEIALGGFNNALCGSARPCPAPNNGAGATFRITD